MTIEEIAKRLEVLPVMAAKIDTLEKQNEAILARLDPQGPPSIPEPVDIWAALDVAAPQAPYHTDEKLGNISSLGTSYGPFSRAIEVRRAWDGVVPSGQVFAIGDDLTNKRKLVKALHEALNQKPDPNGAPKPVPVWISMIVARVLQEGIDHDVLYTAILWGAVGPHHFSGFQDLPVRLAGKTFEDFRMTYLPGEIGSGGGPGVATGEPDKVGGTD